jgi:hypothetical protein
VTEDRYFEYQRRLDAAAAKGTRNEMKAAIDVILNDLTKEPSDDPDVSSVADSAAMILANVRPPNDPEDERMGTQ